MKNYRYGDRTSRGTPTIINADAIAAAINFVEVCCQHTLYITGRQLIADEVNKYKNTKGI